MGFFAISHRHSSSSFEITACHLSFWVIPQPWYRLFRRKYCLDVGLRIKPQDDLRQFRLAIPFDSENEKLVDLSRWVLDPHFSPLIFGQPVEIVGNNVEYNDPSGQGRVQDAVLPISIQDSKADFAAGESQGFSIWTIVLGKRANAGENAYLRFRIPANDPHRIWDAKGWAFAKRGFIADFRIADIRESLLLGLGQLEVDTLIPIQRIFLFLVAPSEFAPKHVSPALHYSRLLETNVWQHYLSGFGLSEAAKNFSIHQWRSPEKTPVTAEKPFRAYMDITREFGFEILFYYVLFGLSLPLLAQISNWTVLPFLVNLFNLLVLPFLTEVFTWLSHYVWPWT